MHATCQFGLLPDDIYYHPTANAWVASMIAILGLSNGYTTVIPNGRFTPEGMFDDVARNRATVALIAPTILQMLIDDPTTRSRDLSSLRMIAFGSSPSTPALIRVAETFRCDLLNCYAMTETTWGGISFLSPADIRRGLGEEPHLLESVGRVSSLFELSIRDDSGAEQPAGVPGEIWLRSEANMLGYLHNDEETLEAVQDSWLRTNDIGRLDADGFLYLLDRRKFMVISGGMNIYPVVIESALAEHPHVL